MNVLKVFGIDYITTPKFLAKAVVTLIGLGLTVNALYDLIKMLPGILTERWPLVIALFLPASFCAWVCYLYQDYKKDLSVPNAPAKTGSVKAHKGIILALSAPRDKSPEVICKEIENTDESSLKNLFDIQGFGQLCKGIHFHREQLRQVWLLTTEQSEPYQKCVSTFLKRFIPQAVICEDQEIAKRCRLSATNDQEWIEQSKAAVNAIYSRSHLSCIGLNISDIITDISGGTKSLTIGMIFGALGSDVDIQYVEQKGKNLIGLTVTSEMLLDKMAEYLMEQDGKRGKR